MTGVVPVAPRLALLFSLPWPACPVSQVSRGVWDRIGHQVKRVNQGGRPPLVALPKRIIASKFVENFSDPAIVLLHACDPWSNGGGAVGGFPPA